MRKKDADQKRAEAPRGKKKWIIIAAVSYTHLTLPTT